MTGEDEPDLAEELEARDQLLLACRELLVSVGTPAPAAVVSHIDALLDLDDEITQSRPDRELTPRLDPRSTGVFPVT